MTLDALEDFFDEFDEVSTLVRYSSNDDFSRYLHQWFGLLDEAPNGIPMVVSALQHAFPWERVESEVTFGNPGMGPDLLKWPERKDDRLGAQLSTFRRLASDEVEGWQFAHKYYYARSNNINDILHEMTEKLFDPFVLELRRYLQRKTAEGSVAAASAPEQHEDTLIVSIDHSSSSYAAVMHHLEELQIGVRTSNVFPTEEKERVLAELRAGAEILKAPRVRPVTLRTLLLGAFSFISSIARGAPIATLADKLVFALRDLLGEAASSEKVS